MNVLHLGPGLLDLLVEADESIVSPDSGDDGNHRHQDGKEGKGSATYQNAFFQSGFPPVI